MWAKGLATKAPEHAYKLHVANYGSESAYTVTIPSKVANSSRADFNNYKTAKQKKNYWTSLFSTSCNSNFSIDFSELIPGNTYYAKARTKVTVKKPVSEQVYNAYDGDKTYDYDYVNGQEVMVYYIYEEQYSNFTNTVKFKLPVSDVSASAEVEKNKITLNIQASNNNLKTGYEIARKSGKQYKVLAKITGNIYEDKNLQSDTKYSYRVRAYTYNSKTKKYTYGDSVFLSKTTWESDIKVQAVQTGKNSAKLTWKKVPGADYYVGYRSTELGTYDSDTKTYKNIDSETMVPVYCFKEGDELANGFAPEYEYYYEIPYSSIVTWEEYRDADGRKSYRR